LHVLLALPLSVAVETVQAASSLDAASSVQTHPMP